MVDLRIQYEKLRVEIDAAIKNVITSTKFIKGPEVRFFEEDLEKYLKVNHVIACGNGTDALQLALMGLGLNRGDEVITTNFSFAAAVEVISLLGLKPVLADPDPFTFNIPPENIQKLITSETKAIIPVHLFGQCSRMEPLMNIAREHNLFVIEDSAQASGTDYIFSDGTIKKAGTIGHAGTTSFFPSKNLSCYGDGGAVITNDDTLAEKIRSIANHGSRIKYHHNYIGINSRLDTLQAAILRVKLRYLDQFNAARRIAADSYNNGFNGSQDIIIPERSGYSTHIFHQYTIRVKNGKRDSLKKFLESVKIPSMIYYPEPLHQQEAYRNPGYNENDFPVTRELCHEVLSLPMHPDLEKDQIDYIVYNVLRFFESN